MLTKHPNIVIALPPKRAARRKKAAALHADMPRIVDAPKPNPRKHRSDRPTGGAQAAPILTSRIVDHSKPSPLDEVDHEAAGAAADRFWQELVRRVNQAAPAQPAPGRKNSRTRSGQ